MTEMWIVTQKSVSLNTTTYGVFGSKDEAWKWINERDPYRQLDWSVRAIIDKDA